MQLTEEYQTYHTEENFRAERRSVLALPRLMVVLPFDVPAGTAPARGGGGGGRGGGKLSRNVQLDPIEHAGTEFCKLMPITSKPTDKAAS